MINVIFYILWKNFYLPKCSYFDQKSSIFTFNFPAKQTPPVESESDQSPQWAFRQLLHCSDFIGTIISFLETPAPPPPPPSVSTGHISSLDMISDTRLGSLSLSLHFLIVLSIWRCFYQAEVSTNRNENIFCLVFSAPSLTCLPRCQWEQNFHNLWGLRKEVPSV